MIRYPPNSRKYRYTHGHGVTAGIHQCAAPQHRVGDVVYERILDAVHRGQLQPGERLNDQELARQLGVSRTPVRESLLRPQVMGVVEIAAARHTRVAVVGRDKTIAAVAVWAALYRLVVTEVFPTASPELIERMRVVADRYRNIPAQPMGDAETPTNEAVIANADFYAEAVAASRNPMLQQAVETVVHVVRLGGHALASRPTRATVLASHQAMLAAIQAHDAAVGHRVLDQILQIDL